MNVEISIITSDELYYIEINKLLDELGDRSSLKQHFIWNADTFYLFKLKESNRLVGYAIVGDYFINVHRDDDNECISGTRYWLESLEIFPEFRSKGYGKYLLSEIKKYISTPAIYIYSVRRAALFYIKNGGLTLSRDYFFECNSFVVLPLDKTININMILSTTYFKDIDAVGDTTNLLEFIAFPDR